VIAPLGGPAFPPATPAAPAAPEAPPSVEQAIHDLFTKTEALPSGSTAWKVEGGALGSPALLGTAVCTTSGGRVACFSAEGAEAWAYDHPSSLSSPVASRDTLYACAQDGHLVAVREGKLAWSCRLPVDENRPPAVGPDGSVFAMGNDGQLYRVSSSGAIQWKKPIKPWIDLDASPDLYTPPVVGKDGTVVVGNMKKYVVAFSGDGKKKWRSKTPGELTMPPAIAEDGRVAMGCYFSQVVLLDPRGHEQWRKDLGARTSSTPAFAPDGGVVIGTDRGQVVKIAPDGRDGEVLLKADSKIVSTPLFDAEGRLYATSWLNSTVYCVPPGRSSPEWTARVGGLAVSQPAISGDGTLFIRTVGAGLAALRTRPEIRANPPAASKPSGPAPTIEHMDGWVVIGGTRVPVRS
jgi:outer membrane protein assembly factor BamB